MCRFKGEVMKTVVFAYHNMGVTGLEALLRHGYDFPLVFTHADDPQENRWFGSIAEWCDDHGVKCVIYDELDEKDCIAMVKHVDPDFIFSFYFRQLLCKAVLDLPRLSALNLHGSLLPKYRGRAPVNWVLVNGEPETGATLHYMLEQPDAGDIVDQEAVEIEENDTALTLFGKIEKAAVILLDRVLPLLMIGEASRYPQNNAEATCFGRRGPEDGLIDWGRNMWEVYNLVRAVTHPYPGAFAYIGGRKLNVWRAEKVDRNDLSAGEMREEQDGVFVGTGEGVLKLIEFEWCR